MTNGAKAASDEDTKSWLRSFELELWERLHKRWDEKTGRQVKIWGAGVGIGITVAGAFGFTSITGMVEGSVRDGVEQAANTVMERVDNDIGRLSDQLAGRLASMRVAVAKLEADAKTADDLIARMQTAAATFDKLDLDLEERIAKVKAATRQYEALETELRDRIAKSEAVASQFSGLERKLLASQKSIELVRENASRVDRIVSSIALTAAPSQETVVTEAAMPLAPDDVGALRVRQVPDKLDKSNRAGQSYYLLNYSIAVAKGETGRNPGSILEAIERVTYFFDERWFKKSAIVRQNREDNFNLSLTVWGSTAFRVEAKLTGRTQPVCWSGRMSLTKTIELEPLRECPPA